MDVVTNARNTNHAYARLIIAELQRCGVTQFVVCPGSQSSPLVLALAEDSKTEVLTHFDERGACFFALGYAKRTGAPAALICTSGSALANLYPAVIEAHEGEVPLLLVTADREDRLQDCGANQTIAQRGFFGDFVRWEYDINTSTAAVQAAHVLTAVDQAVYRSTSQWPGPVHLNVRFARPLLSPAGPVAVDAADEVKLAAWGQTAAPFTQYYASTLVPEPNMLSGVAKTLANAKRGVVLAGSLPPTCDIGAVRSFLQKLGWPVLGEVTSQLRFGGGEQTIQGAPLLCAHAHWYCRTEAFAQIAPPDVVLQLGALPVQLPSNVLTYLDASSARRLLVAATPRRLDPSAAVHERVHCDPAVFCKLLAPELTPSQSALSAAFAEFEQIARVSLDAIPQTLSEVQVVRAVAEFAVDGQLLYLANSLPVRLASWTATQSGTRIDVFCNRGASGIDGTIASAAGAAHSGTAPTVLVCGDLAMLHDLNSLALAKDAKQPFVIVVLNNSGGGIFSYIYDRALGERFMEMTVAPHELTFCEVAAGFGVRYAAPQDLQSFEAAYREALSTPGSTILEITTSQEATAAELRSIERAVAQVF